MAERKPIISFRNFSFQYRAQKRPTLTDIDLEIYPGERVLIAGPSGSGKSTLAGCINGLNPFSNPGACTGTLTVDGVDAPHSSLFELSAHVGTVLQDPDGQFIGLTVGEDIAFALENSCTPQDEMHAITRHAAELVGIENHLGYAPHELSGGQKQRVSLAGVMVDQVKILLFDEPLANLDPATGKQAIELIDEIQKKTDTTVLIIEHRLEDVLWRNVDRIVLVNDGTILADLRPDELLSGSLLAENGIREPLYVTALRYAGVDITPDKHPAHVDSLVLDDTDTQKLRDWVTARPRPLHKPKACNGLFSRSLKLREISAAGCNACEADTNVLGTLVYDLGKFGINFVASPRHADGILVTGPVSRNMREAVLATWAAVPEPRIAIAVGSCAISGGLFADSDECCGGLPPLCDVQLFVPGCPPSPWSILDGLLRLKSEKDVL